MADVTIDHDHAGNMAIPGTASRQRGSAGADIAAADSSGRGLITVAGRQPLLTREEERALADRTRAGDRGAAERLVASHLRFVVSLARRYSRFDLPLTDLIQEGALALTQAVQRFNPDAEVRLATYARAWIRSAMQDYAVRTWSLVRIGAGARQRRLFLTLRRMANDLVDGADALGEKLNRETIARLARQFEVPAREVISVARRLARPDLSLDRGHGANADAGESTRLVDRIADQGPTPEDHVIARDEIRVRRGAIGAALATLTPRERLIVSRRHLADAAESFAAIGRELGLSKERVRVLEKKAMAKLREQLGPFLNHLSSA